MKQIIKLMTFNIVFYLFFGFKCYGVVDYLNFRNINMINCISESFYKKLKNNDLCVGLLDFNKDIMLVPFNAGGVFATNYPDCNSELKIFIPVYLKLNNKFIGELEVKIILGKCYGRYELFEILSNRNAGNIDFDIDNYNFFMCNDNALYKYDDAKFLAKDLKKFVDVEENDKFIYTMPNFKTSNNPREIILIQEGVRNNKKFSRQFEFIPYDHKKYTCLREIKEENKKESVLSKIQNYCSEKINNLRCYFLEKNNSDSINNEEAKKLLPNKAKFN